MHQIKNRQLHVKPQLDIGVIYANVRKYFIFHRPSKLYSSKIAEQQMHSDVKTRRSSYLVALLFDVGDLQRY